MCLKNEFPMEIFWKNKIKIIFRAKLRRINSRILWISLRYIFIAIFVLLWKVCQGRQGFFSCLKNPVNVFCVWSLSLNGELTGNPLDVKLFESIEWDLKEHFNSGVNPDYGVPTPTLVAPPKGPRHGGHFKSAPSNLGN